MQNKIELRPSAAHRWVHCSASANLYAKYADEVAKYDIAGDEATIGTEIHEIAALIADNQFYHENNKKLDLSKYGAERVALAQTYIDYVDSHLEIDAQVWIETKLTQRS